MGGAVRLLLVDDHAIVREGLGALLGGAGFEVVGQAADGAAALERFESLQPDVTLLDIHLPDQSGIDVLRTIRAKHPHARVLMISTYDHDEDVYQSIQLGARGYLLKDASRDELVGAVRAVHQGLRHIPEWVGGRLAARMELEALSEREQEVLEHLAKGRSNREIADALGLSEGTVKAHLNRIFGKMRVADRTQAVLVALRRGLVHLD